MSSKIELDPTDEEESIGDVVSRARALEMAVDSMTVPTEDRSPSSDTSIQSTKLNVMVSGFRPVIWGCTTMTLLAAACLLVTVNFSMRLDTFQETKCLKSEPPKEGLTPSFRKVLE